MKLFNIGKNALYISIIYLGTLIGAESFPCFFQKEITSQAELETVISEESAKLGIKEKIAGKFASERNLSIHRDGENFTIYANKELPLMRTDVQHEVYHYYKDKDKIDNPKGLTLYYLLIAEPRAALYQSTGLKF